ncbi:MAG: hypothetical protein ACYDD1_19425 [Caulobacteraceae bacterium]
MLPAALAGGLLVAHGAQAQSMFAPERFAVGVTAGTDGVGGDLQYLLTPQIVLRGRGTWLEFSYGGQSSDLHYSGKFDLSEGGGFVDFHPFSNPFTVSVGAVAGPRKVNLTAVYTKNVSYLGQTFTPSQLGVAGGAANLSSPAPFVGLGFDNTFTTRSHFGFKVLAGVAFGSAPKTNLQPISGLVTQYPTLIAADLAQADSTIHKNGDIFAYYPQVSAGVTYRF